VPQSELIRPVHELLRAHAGRTPLRTAFADARRGVDYRGLEDAHAPEGAPRDWYLRGADAHPELVAQAVEVGVTVLAGTDTRPHGGVAAEIRALVDAGLRPHDALAAASWTARTWLGLPGLVPGAPADAVLYDRDPRTDLSVLDTPTAVVLRGRRIRPGL